jgi:hypothetical protein
MAIMSSDGAPASRLGVDANSASNSNTGNEALFLKVFSSEILTAFEEHNCMKDLHTIRTISSGKSAQFPVSGVAEAVRHVPGQSLVEKASTYLSDIGHTERTISIDDMLVSSAFVANVDEMRNHYDVRSIYSAEIGKALAKAFDIQAMKTLYAAAKSAASISGQTSGGTVISSTASGGLDSVAEIIDSLYTVAQTLDEKDAPSDGRFAIVTPGTYYKLFTADHLAINKDFANAGNADAAKGTILDVAGIRLYKSNHLKSVADLGDKSSVTTGADIDGVKNNVFDDSGFGGSDGGDGYMGNFANLTDGTNYGILAGTKDAIGTVKLLDLATESEYQIERQGTLFVSKFILGTGVLRPECAVAFEVDAT